MKAFDRQFGVQFLETLPTVPGIYRFYDEKNELIYVGKAKNLRRRVSQYRNAKRRKAHAKMKKIVSEARRFECETCETEVQALTLENQWIQKHRPRWNVAGAFFFLYPLIGIQVEDEGELFLCYTTQPERYPRFQFHGAFRSRDRTREGFFALIELLRLIGHSIPKTQIQKKGMHSGPIKYSYVYGFRQIPADWQSLLQSFLNGENFNAIEQLSLLLLDRPTALAHSKETQERLRTIRSFWRHEITPLKKARAHSKWDHYPVEQKERDSLFIAFRNRP